MTKKIRENLIIFFRLVAFYHRNLTIKKTSMAVSNFCSIAAWIKLAS